MLYKIKCVLCFCFLFVWLVLCFILFLFFVFLCIPHWCSYSSDQHYLSASIAGIALCGIVFSVELQENFQKCIFEEHFG